MRKKRKVLAFFKKIHLPVILISILVYSGVCVLYYLGARSSNPDLNLGEVFLYNILAICGFDYNYENNTLGVLLGIVLFLLSTCGISALIGYVSSAFISNKMNLERGLKKVQKLKGHIVICGWKNDIKSLILDILMKNKSLDPGDIVLVNNCDENKINPLKSDDKFKDIALVKGDYTEEQTLLKANIKEASKVLILGENHDNLDDELIDSRVFVASLMVRNMNPKSHICAEVKTERYKNYLEAQNCAEVIYSDAYTRYILSTSTNYSGMSKVMSAFLDDGDGINVQIVPIDSSWFGKTFGDLSKWYKENKNTIALGVLTNMGVEKELKHQILTEAQKSTNYGEIVSKLKDVKNLESNCPKLNPGDDFILNKNMGAIILGEEN